MQAPVPWTGRAVSIGPIHLGINVYDQLDHAAGSRYAKRFPAHNSDTLDESPWRCKTLLSMDGGGIRGYSSLLIIKRLLSYIAFLEKGGTLVDSQGQRHEFLACSSSMDYPWSDDQRPSVTPGIHGANGSSSQLPGKTPEAQNQDASAGASAFSDRSHRGSGTPEPASVKEAKSQGEHDPDRSKAAKHPSRRTTPTNHARDQDCIATSSRYRDAPAKTGESFETLPDNIEAADLGDRGLEPPENTHRRVSGPSDVSGAQYQVSGAALEIDEPSPGHSSNTLNTAVSGGLDGEPGEQNVSPGHPTAIIDPVDEITNEDLRGFFVHHYFDYVAGTSTGGLSALTLSRMKMNIVDAMKQYDTIGNKVFAHPRRTALDGKLRPKYNKDRMKEALYDVLKEGLREESQRTGKLTSKTTMKNESDSTCHTAVLAYGAIMHPQVYGSYIFRSYEHKVPDYLTEPSRLYNYGPASEAKIWKVARATSAAPGYFSKQRIDNRLYEDGGRGCNNPSLHVFEDIGIKHRGRHPELVVSIGTGTKAESDGMLPPDEPAQKKAAFNPVRHPLGLLKIATKELPEQITDPENDHQRLQGRIKEINGTRRQADPRVTHPSYSRFNVKLLGAKVKLDEWKPSRPGPNGYGTLDKLRQLTDEYLKEETTRQFLRDCAIKLVHIRRMRAETERWEKYATQISYSCPTSARCGGARCHDRKAFRDHAFNEHAIIEQDSPAPDQGDLALVRQVREVHGGHPERLSEQEFEAWLDGGRKNPSIRQLQKRDSPKNMKEERRPWLARVFGPRSDNGAGNKR